MNNLGTGEILIVAIVLFILFGGKKLPELARGLGEAGRQFNAAFKGEDETDKPKKTPPKKDTKVSAPKKGGD